jgi:hypothetical protein
MARLYTKRDMDAALKELRIAPEEGKVSGSEAARILTWRAKDEYAIEHTYDANSIRLHVRQGHFPLGSIDKPNKRNSLYRVEDVFHLPIHPNRGPRKPVSEAS